MESQLEHQEGVMRVVGEEISSKQAKEQSDLATSSPPSPSHEFSFHHTLHPSPKVPNKAMSPSSFSAADLSPADDIFFHGHLLPLHFLSHLPITPRSSSSTDSSESFSLPIKPDGLEDIEPNCNHNNRTNCGTKGGIKGKSFTLLWSGNWRKSAEVEEKNNNKKKFKVRSILKKYLRTVGPLLLFRGGKKNGQLCNQTYSFSSNSSLEEMQQWGGETELSTPAMSRTSPANTSPVFTATFHSSNTNYSTMEELQSAIQAAIVHCKNSIAKEGEKLRSQD